MDNPLNPSAPWSGELLERMRGETDPLADALITRLIAERGPAEARRMFDLLITQLELPLASFPPYVADFATKTRILPEWTDWEKVRKGEVIFQDHGPKFLIFLYYRSLPTLYACWRGAKVLVMTGRLAHDANSLETFSRRVAETGQFLIDIMSPNSLLQGHGIQMAQKVRLIHAAIRHFIPTEQWQQEEWGKPINQEDLALTLMTFSISMIEAMEQIGLPLTDEEAEAYLHTWKIVGHVLGIRPELLPENVAAGRLLLNTILDRQKGSSAAGTLLAKALVDFGEKVLPTKLFDNAPEILIRYLSGEELATLLQVRRTWGCLTFALPRVLRKYMGLAERLEDQSEPMSVLMDRISRALTRAMVGYFNTYKDAPLQVPATLRKAWGLTADASGES